MYKLKKNCGNIFSKYGLCRVLVTAWFSSNVVIHIPCTVTMRHYVLSQLCAAVNYMSINDLICVEGTADH